MPTVKTTRDFAQQLRALVPGLPRYCTRIVITLEVDALPEVVVTFNPELDVTTMASTEAELKPSAESVTRRYQLVPIGESAPEADSAVNVAGVSREQIVEAIKTSQAEMQRRLRAAGILV